MSPTPRTLIAFLKAMEFTSITKRVAAHFEVEDVDAIARRRPTVANVLPHLTAGIAARQDAARRRGRRRARMRAPINHDAYVTVTDGEGSGRWIARARETGIVCVDTETTSLDPMQAELCGVSLAVAPGEACYIPCGHRKGDGLALDRRQGGEHRADAAKPMCWRG